MSEIPGKNRRILKFNCFPCWLCSFKISGGISFRDCQNLFLPPTKGKIIHSLLRRPMLGDSAIWKRIWRLFNYENNSRYFKLSQTFYIHDLSKNSWPRYKIAIKLSFNFQLSKSFLFLANLHRYPSVKISIKQLTLSKNRVTFT